MNSGTFQKVVNAQPAPAAPGDFAGTNPRMSMLAGPGELFAGALGLMVGLFAWADSADSPRDANNYFTEGSALGFVHREQQALLTGFLEGAGVTVPPGYEVTLMSQGEFWALFSGGGATGAAVYALAASGQAVAGAPAITRSTGIHAHLDAGVLTVTVDGSPTGQIGVGSVITSAAYPENVVITALGSGTGGAGTYVTNRPDLTIGAQTDIAATYAVLTPWTLASVVVANSTAAGTVIDVNGVMTVSGGVTGPALTPGMQVTGAGVPAGVFIRSQLTGSVGGNGTYQLNTEAAVSSFAATFTQGQVGKISTWQS